MSNIATLQNALNTSSGKKPAPVASSSTTATPETTAPRPPSRAGQVNISSWLSKDFKKSLRLVQAKRSENATIQDLMAEALNDLFSKYNVPTVNQD